MCVHRRHYVYTVGTMWQPGGNVLPGLVKGKMNVSKKNECYPEAVSGMYAPLAANNHHRHAERDLVVRLVVSTTRALLRYVVEFHVTICASLTLPTIYYWTDFIAIRKTGPTLTAPIRSARYGYYFQVDNRDIRRRNV